MVIFENNAYFSAGRSASSGNTGLTITQNHPGHLQPSGRAGFGIEKQVNVPRGRIEAEASGSFENVLLQALDKVSGAQLRASDLQKEAIINPGSVDIHDVTIAQAEASMALGITRNVLSRLVQGWRDLINTR